MLLPVCLLDGREPHLHPSFADHEDMEVVQHERASLGILQLQILNERPFHLVDVFERAFALDRHIPAGAILPCACDSRHRSVSRGRNCSGTSWFSGVSPSSPWPYRASLLPAGTRGNHDATHAASNCHPMIVRPASNRINGQHTSRVLLYRVGTIRLIRLPLDSCSAKPILRPPRSRFRLQRRQGPGLVPSGVPCPTHVRPGRKLTPCPDRLCECGLWDRQGC